MKESDVMAIFNEYKKQLIKKLGKHVTDNTQLEKIAFPLIGSRFKGVYAQDTLPVNKNGMYVMNNQKSNRGGEHWVAIVITTKRIYVWDSFGRNTKSLLTLLTKKAKDGKKTIVDADYDAEQNITTAVCGPLSLAWLLTVKQVGITDALKV